MLNNGLMLYDKMVRGGAGLCSIFGMGRWMAS